MRIGGALGLEGCDGRAEVAAAAATATAGAGAGAGVAGLDPTAAGETRQATGNQRKRQSKAVERALQVLQ